MYLHLYRQLKFKPSLPTGEQAMIALPEHLEQSFLQIAEAEHKPVMKVIEQALIEFLEDYQDTKLAEQAMKDIESGKDKVLNLADAKRLYDDLVS